MKHLLSLILSLSLFALFCSGCNTPQFAVQSSNSPIAQPTANKSVNTASILNENIKLTNDAENQNSPQGDEIKSCSPQKLYFGETLTLSFNKPHGGYLAILRKKGNIWFFLYSREENKTPSWDIDELKPLSEIEINTETARNYATYKEFDRVNERIFKKTGWYRLMVSHEDFGQDDPPWTGMCEIYYINKKRPNR